MSSREAVSEVAEAFLAASLPIDPNVMDAAAERVIDYYANAPSRLALPEEEVAGRFTEMWTIWLTGDDVPVKELRDAVNVAICIDDDMAKLAKGYFALEKKLENAHYLPRQYAIALVGCAPLIRSLVVEQHLGLDRIRAIINVPGVTHESVGSVLSAMGVPAPYSVDVIPIIHDADVKDVADFFGDTPPDEAEQTFNDLLGNFARKTELWENITELVYINYEPYLFMLYYELLTLESTDRFPGQCIRECNMRSKKVKALWNEMYHPTQENPYLNNAKAVYSLDESWATNKLSKETQNGSLMLVNTFEVLSELPYTTRRRVAHIIRCFLIHVAARKRTKTPLAPITPVGIRRFVERVSDHNSLTKGVLDQRLVDFLTYCAHDWEGWVPRGLGSSVNETNASGRKYGDVEYLDLETRTRIEAYEAHGGGLRDEYVQDHINSLLGTVEYHKHEAVIRGEDYTREVEVVYVAHDISRLSKFKDGHHEIISGIPFTFRFITFDGLLEEAGGMDTVIDKLQCFDELVHDRISRLPDAYPLKRRYQEIIG